MERGRYSDMFGPTVGDRVVLGDTCLAVRVDKDFTVYGDEIKFGGGKTIREGMGQATSRVKDGANGGVCEVFPFLDVDYL